MRTLPLSPMKLFLARIAKKVLPKRFVDWYRRRRATRRYLRALGSELYQRNTRMDLENLEGRIAARKQGFYEGLVKDVLQRTELVLQELDRRIEGLNARHGNELRALRSELEALRSEIDRLRTSGEEEATSRATTTAASTAAVPAASDR